MAETLYHRKLKEQIAQACTKYGWRVQVEARVGTQTADVLAEKGNRLVVFEVQWSRAGKRELTDRNRKYRLAGAESVWFTRFVPEPATPEVKTIGLSRKGERAKVGCRELSIEEAVKLSLNNGLIFRRSLVPAKVQAAEVFKFPMICWKCGRITQVIHPSPRSLYRSVCGCKLWQMHLSDEPLGQALSELQKKGMRELRDVGPIRKRFSRTMGTAYWSNGCKWCGAIMGEWFVIDELLEYIYENPEPAFRMEFEVEVSKLPFELREELCRPPSHWCFRKE